MLWTAYARRMQLQCCLNGARRSREHEALPTSPAQIAAAVATVAGLVTSVHLHVKDHHGADIFDAEATAAALTAVRRAAPGLPIGTTTGAWAAPAVADRLARIAEWTTLPDFASVNWHEDGADDVAAALISRGIGVEAGIWHREGLAAWVRSPVRDACSRVLVEVPDLPEAEALPVADDLVGGVREVRPDVEILLHGEESSAWPILLDAGRRGLSTRIGLEDTLVHVDGRAAASNLDLVQDARAALGLA